MNSIIVSGAFLLVGFGAALFLLIRNARAFKSQVADAIKELQATLAERELLAKELQSFLALGVNPEDLKALQDKIEQLELTKDSVNAQLSAVDDEANAQLIQIKELDAVIAEFEKSSERGKDDYAKMIEDEAVLVRETEDLRNGLQSSFLELDKLLEQLSDSKDLGDQLSIIKTKATTLLENIASREAETRELREKYFGLKRNYDALDLEYAQLYERQNNSPS